MLGLNKLNFVIMVNMIINGMRKGSKIEKLNSGRDLSVDTRAPHLLGLVIINRLFFSILYGHW